MGTLTSIFGFCFLVASFHQSISLRATQIKKIKMSTAAFDMGPAGRVAPLIKLTRWTLLIAGIYYGSKRYTALKAIEDNRRAYEASMEATWAAEDAAAKEAADKQGMADLAKMAVVPGY